MKKDVVLMKSVFLMLFISSLSLMLATVADFRGSGIQVFLAYFTGIVFWLFLILGYVLFFQVSKHRKEYERTRSAEADGEGRRRSREYKKTPGIICFFSNRYAVVADIAMIIFFILSLVFLLIPSLSQNAAIIFISLFILSLHMHGILNGVNYRYIRSVSKK